jgi:hypothetical protein
LSGTSILAHSTPSLSPSSAKLSAERIERRAIALLSILSKSFKRLSGAGDWPGLKTFDKAGRLAACANPGREERKRGPSPSSLILPARLKLEAKIRRRDSEAARDMPERAGGEYNHEIWRMASAEFLALLRRPGLTLRAPIARRLKSGLESARSDYKTHDDDRTRLLGALLPRTGGALSPEAKKTA